MIPQEVEEAILSVAEDPGLRAMQLSGPWGIGKTYLVTELFEKKITAERLKNQKRSFAYVSLFGVNSVAEVRKRLCLAALTGKKSGFLKVVAKARKAVPSKISVQGVDVDLGGIGDLASSLVEDRSLNSLFVCIDDLERAGADLAVRDVLGLIAELTETRDCRCLLIFNREKLGDEGRKELVNQDEKIFDLSIEYTPTPAHSLSIGFSEREDREFARSAFEVFENANIRIMKRVGWVLREMRNTNAPHLNELWPDLVNHASVLTILHFAHADKVPDILAAIRYPTAPERIYKEESEEGKVPSDILARLDKLGFGERQFDQHIVALLLRGFLNRENFVAAVEAAHRNQLQANQHAECEGLINEIQNGFEATSANYVPRLRKFLSKPDLELNRVLLAELCDILLGVEDSDENRRIVLNILEPIFRPASVAERAEALRRFPSILKTELHKNIQFKPNVIRLPLPEVVAKLAELPNGWDPFQYQRLEEFGDAEILDYLLSLRGPGVIFQSQRLLNRLDGIEDQQLASRMRTRLRAIFEDIGRRDTVFRYQIEHFVLGAPKHGT